MKRSALPFFAAAVLSAILLGPAALSARVWKQAATGREIEAELIKVEDGQAFLRRADGTVGQVEIITLSVEDQAYIAEREATMAAASASVEGWPAFRGPRGDGISPDEGLLDTWPEGGPSKLWVFEDAGMGYSGFIVVDGRLYTMGTRGEDLYVISIDVADGTEVWSSKIGTDDQQGYNAGWGHGPRSTPTYSEGLIYAKGPKGALACLEADGGKVVWSKDLRSDFSGQAGGWGFSASPFVDGPNLIIAPGGNKAGIVALDKKNGRTVWEAKDLTPGKAEYATIQLAEINGVRHYVRLFESELVGVKADDGTVLWRSPWEGRTAVIPTPIVDGNQIYISSGYGVGSKLVEIDEDFQASDVWQNTVMKNHHGGVVKVGDHLYGFSDGAGLICQEWATGEMVWNERGQYTTKGAVHVADGLLYALNEQDGALTLGKATPEGFETRGRLILEPQSENRHPQGRVWTHPLVIGGALYLRDQEFIVAYDVKAR